MSLHTARQLHDSLGWRLAEQPRRKGRGDLGKGGGGGGGEKENGERGGERERGMMNGGKRRDWKKHTFLPLNSFLPSLEDHPHTIRDILMKKGNKGGERKSDV